MIKSMPPNDNYRSGWDKIWGNKCKGCSAGKTNGKSTLCQSCIDELFSLSEEVGAHFCFRCNKLPISIQTGLCEVCFEENK